MERENPVVYLHVTPVNAIVWSGRRARLREEVCFTSECADTEQLQTPQDSKQDCIDCVSETVQATSQL